MRVLSTCLHNFKTRFCKCGTIRPSKISHIKTAMCANFSARLITGSYEYDHITPVLKSLHWLPVEQRIGYKIAVLGFKCVNGSAPGYLQNLVELYTSIRTLRSSSDKLTLSIPKVRTLYGERSFRYHCAVEWNTLPYDIRSCESLDSFKAKLKTYLFFFGISLVKLSFIFCSE